jgi:hypothetical protein
MYQAMEKSKKPLNEFINNFYNEALQKPYNEQLGYKTNRTLKKTLPEGIQTGIYVIHAEDAVWLQNKYLNQISLPIILDVLENNNFELDCLYYTNNLNLMADNGKSEKHNIYFKSFDLDTLEYDIQNLIMRSNQKVIIFIDKTNCEYINNVIDENYIVTLKKLVNTYDIPIFIFGNFKTHNLQQGINFLAEINKIYKNNNADIVIDFEVLKNKFNKNNKFSLTINPNTGDVLH